MPRTILCPQCGLVLSIPEGAAGRRLKCPKCAARFPADPTATNASPTPESRGHAASGGVARNGGGATSPTREPSRPKSSQIIPSVPPGRGDEEVRVQANEAPLRELFAGPSSGESSSTSVPPIPSSAGEADAASLFKDDEPKFQRKPLPSAGRSALRRCPSCANVVQVGMSLCQRCGLNLDTGERISLDDDLLPVSATRVRTPPPLGVMLVGGLAMAASVVCAVASIVMLSNGNQGAPFLLLTCLFGIFASTQYVRGKSYKHLIVALSLGAMFAVVAFIALPIYDSSAQIELTEEGTAIADDSGPELGAFQEQIDFSKISWGIASLLGYAALVLYINSPKSKRYFSRKSE